MKKIILWTILGLIVIMTATVAHAAPVAAKHHHHEHFRNHLKPGQADYDVIGVIIDSHLAQMAALDARGHDRLVRLAMSK